jgi:hypothetical protein
VLEPLEKLVTAGLVEGARAADDDAAIKRAQQLPESHEVELWCGGRFIVKLTTPKKVASRAPARRNHAVSTAVAALS